MKYESIEAFNESQSAGDRRICVALMKEIDRNLSDAEKKIWHGHPVWFLDGNPIVGYSTLKDCVRLMFWSGADFDEERLRPGTGKFRDASVRYTSDTQVRKSDLARWLDKSRSIQWDYKNVARRKGKLERIGNW